ncbi:MAG: class I SAM-dependent methyltransferase [Candidatus Ozemobacteraceae bacterium]
MVYLYRWLSCHLPRTRFIRNVPGITYLDFGCGDGTVLKQNKAIRPDLSSFGVDIQNFGKSMPADTGFCVFDGLRLPFPANFFEIITLNHVLEHIPNPDPVFGELKRVMKTGAQIYIETPNHRSLRPRKSKLFAGTIEFFDDPTHLKPFSTQELIEAGTRNGFRVVDSGIVRNLLHLLLAPLLFLGGVLFPSQLWYMYARNSLLGWSSYVVLEKEK